MKLIGNELPLEIGQASLLSSCDLAINNGALSLPDLKVLFRQWLLDDLRDLITLMAEAGEKSAKLIGSILARLNRTCHLGKEADHTKLSALAKEILKDWEAVVAFVHHPELPLNSRQRTGSLHAISVQEQTINSGVLRLPVLKVFSNPLTMRRNERERHAVISRQISYGTRTSEGSLAYSSLLSVIETCRLRKLNPWSFIAEVIAAARKGLNPPLVPTA